MEEHGVFKPLETIDNPMGLCRFYQRSSKKSNVLTGLKSTDSARKIHDMVKLAKGVGQPLTVVVFKGEMVTSLGLLQELHSHLTLSRIAIHMPDEVKMGPKNCVSCFPICTFMVKKNYLLLNHIIVGHYWSSFSCGKCLKFMAFKRQQMKRHIQNCGKPKKESKKKHSKGDKAPKVQSSPKSGHKSKKVKNKADKEGGSMAEQKKPHGLPSKSSGTVAASQEQAPNTPRHSAHNTNSTSVHPKKSKKHEKSKKKSK